MVGAAVASARSPLSALHDPPRSDNVWPRPQDHECLTLCPQISQAPLRNCACSHSLLLQTPMPPRASVPTPGADVVGALPEPNYACRSPARAHHRRVHLLAAGSTPCAASRSLPDPNGACSGTTSTARQELDATAGPTPQEPLPLRSAALLLFAVFEPGAPFQVPYRRCCGSGGPLFCSGLRCHSFNLRSLISHRARNHRSFWLC